MTASALARRARGLPAAQVRAALAVRLPRAQRAEPQAPKALTAVEYARLLSAAKARIADDPLAGARDLGDRQGAR